MEPTPIRIFISSPGDVKRERALTETITNRVASELGLPVSIRYSSLLSGKSDSGSGQANPKAETTDAPGEELLLCPYYWEYQSYHADAGYQDQIPRTDQFDLVVCILWSRMGSRLSAKFENPDGGSPRSGTEYEIQWARHQRQLQQAEYPDLSLSDLSPALHVYRNRSKPVVPDESEEGRAFFDQKDQLEDFISDWQKAADGAFKGAFNSYHDLGQFERIFEAHFRDFLEPYLKKRKFVPRTKHPLLWNPAERGSPYRRLDVYDIEHEPIFCGRSKAIGEVIDAMRHQVQAGTPFTLIVGASGSGKSSLARAGVLPMLMRPDVIAGVELWRHAVLRPGDRQHGGNPCRALAAAMLSDGALPGLGDPEAKAGPLDKLADQLANRPEGLIDRIEDQLNRIADEAHREKAGQLQKAAEEFRQAGRPGDAEAAEIEQKALVRPKARLALVVDQFEELFHGDRSEKSVTSFLVALEKISQSGRVFVIATLRSDFYDRYQQHPELVRMAGKNGKVDLLPPDEDEIGQIIRQPAAAAGLGYEKHPDTGKALDEELRDKAKGNPDSLPLLSHVLDLLYQRQAEREKKSEARGPALMRWKDYEDLKGIEGALATHADDVYLNKLGDEERSAFPHVLSGLVNLGSGDQGEEVALRQETRLEDLIHDGKNETEIPGAARLIEMLSGEECRLLTMRSGDEPTDIFVSVSHEILLRKWDKVTKWVKENDEFLRRRNRVELMRQHYESALKELEEKNETSGSPKDYLLAPGLPLEEGLSLLTKPDQVLTRELVEYIAESKTAASRDAKKRMRVRNGFLFALLAAACLAVFGAVVARRNAEAAERELYRSSVKNAYEAAYQNLTIEAVRALTKAPEKYRGWEWRYLQKRVGFGPMELLPNQIGFLNMGVMKDTGLYEKAIAMLDPRTDLGLWWRPTPSFDVRGTPGGRPGGMLRVYSRENGLSVLELETQNYGEIYGWWVSDDESCLLLKSSPLRSDTVRLLDDMGLDSENHDFGANVLESSGELENVESVVDRPVISLIPLTPNFSLQGRDNGDGILDSGGSFTFRSAERDGFVADVSKDKNGAHESSYLFYGEVSESEERIRTTFEEVGQTHYLNTKRVPPSDRSYLKPRIEYEKLFFNMALLSPSARDHVCEWVNEKRGDNGSEDVNFRIILCVDYSQPQWPALSVNRQSELELKNLLKDEPSRTIEISDDEAISLWGNVFKYGQHSINAGGAFSEDGQLIVVCPFIGGRAAVLSTDDLDLVSTVRGKYTLASFYEGDWSNYAKWGFSPSGKFIYNVREGFRGNDFSYGVHESRTGRAVHEKAGSQVVYFDWSTADKYFGLWDCTSGKVSLLTGVLGEQKGRFPTSLKRSSNYGVEQNLIRDSVEVTDRVFVGNAILEVGEYESLIDLRGKVAIAPDWSWMATFESLFTSGEKEIEDRIVVIDGLLDDGSSRTIASKVFDVQRELFRGGAKSINSVNRGIANTFEMRKWNTLDSLKWPSWGIWSVPVSRVERLKKLIELHDEELRNLNKERPSDPQVLMALAAHSAWSNSSEKSLQLVKESGIESVELDFYEPQFLKDVPELVKALASGDAWDSMDLPLDQLSKASDIDRILYLFGESGAMSNLFSFGSEEHKRLVNVALQFSEGRKDESAEILAEALEYNDSTFASVMKKDFPYWVSFAPDFFVEALSGAVDYFHSSRNE